MRMISALYLTDKLGNNQPCTIMIMEYRLKSWLGEKKES